MVQLQTQGVNDSPLYPSNVRTLDENTLCSGAGVFMNLVLAEPQIFLRGFDHRECTELTPALLRGSLIVKVTRPTKIKGIRLTFKGVSRTEWPEGLPPAKTETSEVETHHSHVWPFFTANSKTAEYSSGAHLVRLAKDAPSEDHLAVAAGDASSTLSVPGSHRKGLFKLRSASPQPGSRTRIRRSGSSSSADSEEGMGLAPHRSFSKTEKQDSDVMVKGYRNFQPGEYIYNFELPIPHSLPETIDTTAGSVKYMLEGLIERPGAFKSNLTGRREVELIRATSLNNMEPSEPITIDRAWEDQMAYNIEVAGKLFVIGESIPISFKLERLNDEVKCHRIRVYVSEKIECRSSKVRSMRSLPNRRYMLKEHITEEGLSGNLAQDPVTQIDTEVMVPKKLMPGARERLHPKTTYDNIQVHHWLKIVLRLSKMSENRRKYFEISIDSPIGLLHERCNVQNLILPQYKPLMTPRTPAFNRTHSIGTPMDQQGNPFDMLVAGRPSLITRPTTSNPPPYEYQPPSYAEAQRTSPTHSTLELSHESDDVDFDENHIDARSSFEAESRRLSHFSPLVAAPIVSSAAPFYLQQPRTRSGRASPESSYSAAPALSRSQSEDLIDLSPSPATSVVNLHEPVISQEKAPFVTMETALNS